MEIIYKQKPRSKYDVALEKIRKAFPGRRFRIIVSHGEIFDDEVGIEEVSWSGLFSKELDLEAMGLI
jgi:hypothetical protein